MMLDRPRHDLWPRVYLLRSSGGPGWWYLSVFGWRPLSWLRHGGWFYFGPKAWAWWWLHGVRYPVARLRR